jgi:hypothetical protein
LCLGSLFLVALGFPAVGVGHVLSKKFNRPAPGK